MRHAVRDRNLLLGGGVVLAACVGFVLPAAPALALAAPAALCALLLLVSAKARGAFLVLGGLIVLQSSQHLTTVKVLYFAGVVVTVVAASHNARFWRAPRPILLASAMVATAVVVSLPVALFNHIALTDWARDAFPYLLLALVPLFAADLATAGHTYVVRLLLISGSLGCIAFCLTWLDRRGYLHTPIGHVGLASFPLSAAFVSYATAAAFVSEQKLRWAGVGLIAALLLLVTGTRTVLVLVLVPLVIAMVVGIGSARRGLLLAAGLLACAVLVVAFQGVIDTTGLREAEQRLLSVRTDQDPSLAERAVVRAAAWNTFVNQPALGAGLGYRFHYLRPYPSTIGQAVDTTTVDTVLTTPAKLGLLGAISVAVLFVTLLVYSAREARRLRTASTAGLLAFLAVMVPYAVFTQPFDDKGLAFSLLMFLALVASEPPWPRRERVESPRRERFEEGPARPSPSISQGKSGTWIDVYPSDDG